MARPKRTKAGREQALQTVASLLLRGHSQSEIAGMLGLNRSTICRDVRKIREAWRSKAIAHYDDVVGRELARLDEVERQAWQAWEASRGVVTSVTTTRRAGGQERRRKVERRAGDPGFLEAVLACVDRRARLLGLQEVHRARTGLGVGSEAGNPYARLSDRERLDRLLEMFDSVHFAPGDESAEPGAGGQGVDLH